ncbi:DNA polymerase III subunit gamma/tau [Plastoroseomonas arctica]|uniref:DNA polymerase III subunit gamma/tau n=1 Tax=Plastoroseomonas arctica TaxID=1509237 RepID=A0AAF1KHZ3_9PROT|nr:DNA polymerase III subunit gamma/tau [Plastoroseomonas arctica]MBR0654509.1 DNA polymerase III subunit gamma/tau [Plastoroseomonas arctica]
MASGLFGDDAPPEAGLPEPPQDGDGLFGEVAAAPAPVARAADTQYRVLARKYRPSTFGELIGQDALVRTLRNAFAQNRVPHALLLTGVRGVGKTTTARIIARALNCIGPDGTGGPTVDPCGVCAECRAILADRHPDVQELDAASNNGVDDVRELRERLRYRPAQGRNKVLVLDEVHMLSSAAFNALLKTLEEPPAQVVFVLATTELRKVPVTIRSRCQTHHLRRVSQAELHAHFARILGLENVAAEDEALAMIARAAEGSVRDGLSILDQAIALGGDSISAEIVREMLGLADRGLVLDVMEAVLEGRIAEALGLMDRAHERGADPLVLITDLLEYAHLLTRFRLVETLADDRSLPEEDRTRGVALARRMSIPVLGRAWQMLLKGVAEVQQEGVDRRAAAEMVLIRLAHVAELPTPGDLIKRLTQPGADAPPRAAPEGGGGGMRAVANGAPVMQAAPALPNPQSFRDVVALASGRKPMLHAHLVHSVHPIAVAPGRIELRPTPAAPRDLASQLAAFLTEQTGARWTVTLSNAEGEPTLAELGRTAAADRMELVRSHPIVQAVLAAFPGAVMDAVRDQAADAYGLVPETPAARTAEPDEDFPDFAPLDADFAYTDDDTPPEDF